MQRYDEEQVRKMQAAAFGRRFAGASLANFSDASRDAESLTRFLVDKQGFLVIHGPSGTGKTHLLAAIYADQANLVDSIRVLTDRALFRKLRSGMSGEGDYLEALEMLMDSHLVMIDDIGSSGHTDWREEVLMEAIDTRYRENRPTILTSNLDKEQISEAYGERISSRMFDKNNTVINAEDWARKRE